MRTKISEEGGGSKFLGAVGVGWGVEVLILIPKELYYTCNFPGVGVQISRPPPLYGFII